MNAKPAAPRKCKKLVIIIPSLRHPNRDKYALHNRKRLGGHHA